ncbi:penicillin acylase family protein [uncultured Sphingomonas sp.]|uniref:penicillin acylase family protein n=1 Tax=uncultured Sphingomonas sp. TaxID=158754 RepID=UPI0025F806BA|nr:penicillin acylase family protein [uncultured Sphingomonas sp.]
MTTRAFLRRIGLVLGISVILICILTVVALGWFAVRLERSAPRLEGNVSAPGLTAPVTIARDGDGVPTVTGNSRADLAYATGYLHAQERFFQMDTLRRVGAGELAALFGPQALAMDRKTRLHRFRARANQVLARIAPGERRILDAYVTGVNRGLADLGAPPFEYALLRQTPQRWTAADSLLAVYAMYLDLQGGGLALELQRARATARLGGGMADLLYPLGTELDAPLDGSTVPEPFVPAGLSADAPARNPAPAVEPMVKGSNNWAVAGALTNTGAAMVANDMHLGTRIPNTWYRVRLMQRGARGRGGALDVVGVTLPGIFPTVVGSNGFVAWGFTVANADTHDAVIVEPVAGRPGWYRTPAGPRPVRHIAERLCTPKGCEALVVRETIWGPIVAKLPDGREVADRWIAHDAQAIRLAPMLAIEGARDAASAVRAAHRVGLPNENMVIGDRDGHVAWTIAGQVPQRFGFDGRTATSWADGRAGWRGMLPPDQVPTIMDPGDERVWTANARVVGGAALTRLGDGGYDDGSRAREIRRRLFARARFVERDMLSIQLDTAAPRALFWRSVMLRALARHPDDRGLRAMIAPVKAWNGHADTGSVGYRLIRAFRLEIIKNAYVAYLGVPDDSRTSYAGPGAEQALRTLLRRRPPALVPPGYASWDALLDAGLGDVAKQVRGAAHGRVDRFTWGAYMHADVRHPLGKAIPLLRLITDPADHAVPGDGGAPRAQYAGGGASERLVVSPGHEAQGLFHMPGGQSGAPFAPYYLAGHEAWLNGEPRPLLPGLTRWTLTLHP